MFLLNDYKIRGQRLCSYIIYVVAHSRLMTNMYLANEPISVTFKVIAILKCKLHTAKLQSKMFKSVVLSLFTDLCNQHDCLMIEHFHHSKRNPIPTSSSCSLNLLAFPGNHQSTSCLCGFFFLEILYKHNYTMHVEQFYLMFSRSICIQHALVLSCFLLLNFIKVHHILFLHSSANEHLSYFYSVFNKKYSLKALVYIFSLHGFIANSGIDAFFKVTIVSRLYFHFPTTQT